MSEVARQEALAARWHLEPQDVAPIMGPVGAQWWGQLVTASDPSAILHQLEYRTEAGSARKPNRDTDLANATLSMQTLFAPLFQLAMNTGQVMPVNALIQMWAKANEIDGAAFMIQPPPPPMPMPGEEGAQQQPHETSAA